MILYHRGGGPFSRFADRKSPSFPVDHDDAERVFEAMRRLKAGRGKMTAVGQPGIPMAAVNAAFRAQDLSEEALREIASGQMSAEHKHLNQLLTER